MNCKKCGNILASTDQFCPSCGEPNESFNGGVTQTVPEAPSAPVAPAAPETPIEPSPVPMQTAANPLNQTPIAPMPTAAPAAPAKPKKNVLFIIAIIIMSLVIVGLGVFIAIKLLGGKAPEPNQDVQNINTKPTEVVNTNETITFGGLTFTIPTGLEKKTLDGETALVDSTNGYMIFLEGLTDEESLADVKTQYPSYEEKYKQEITAQGGTYIGASEYTLTGRKYFGVSYYIKNVYSDIVFTEITDNYLFVGSIVYKTSSKDVAYKSLNELLNSAKSPKAGSFAKNITKDQILSGNVTVRDDIE